MIRIFRNTAIVLVLLLLSSAAVATDEKSVRVAWPTGEQAIVEFNIGQPHATGVIAGGDQINYSADVRAKNLWDRKFRGMFTLQILDAQGTQIGEVPVPLDLGPGQAVAIPCYFTTVGKPTNLRLVPSQLPPALRAYLPDREVAITIRSSPVGASVELDGKEIGATPAVVEVAPGAHKLILKKEGFTTYTHALVVQPDETSGGSVDFELSAAGDIAELRDGTLLVGDLVSIDFKKVVMRVDGKDRTMNRNELKRVSLVERATP